VPLPVQVIAETLGIPQERFQDFRRWSVAKDSNFGKRKTHDEWAESAKAARDMRIFIAQESAARVASPRDDLIGTLVATSLEETRDPSVEDPLTIAQVNEINEELLVAGNVTTTQLIAETINQLIDHPDRLHAVRSDAAQVTDVIEEVLRLAGPVMGLFRRSTEETLIGGTVAPANALLMIYYGSVSHDEAMFEDPFEFRPGRENGNRHLGFGHGLHLCVGAPLARAEARFAVPRLLERLPDLRRDGGRPGRYQENFLTRRLTTLPIAWDAGMGAAALPG
jgi:cytochrome P450